MLRLGLRGTQLHGFLRESQTQLLFTHIVSMEATSAFVVIAVWHLLNVSNTPHLRLWSKHIKSVLVVGEWIPCLHCNLDSPPKSHRNLVSQNNPLWWLCLTNWRPTSKKAKALLRSQKNGWLSPENKNGIVLLSLDTSTHPADTWLVGHISGGLGPQLGLLAWEDFTCLVCMDLHRWWHHCNWP